MATPAVGGSARPSAAPPGARPVAAAPRIGSDEYHSATLPLTQEAAVLYSASYAEHCARLLKALVKDPAGSANKQAWLMLFDVYQVQQNRQEFDALSMLYSVKFE